MPIGQSPQKKQTSLSFIFSAHLSFLFHPSDFPSLPKLPPAFASLWLYVWGKPVRTNSCCCLWKWSQPLSYILIQISPCICVVVPFMSLCCSTRTEGSEGRVMSSCRSISADIKVSIEQKFGVCSWLALPSWLNKSPELDVSKLWENSFSLNLFQAVKKQNGAPLQAGCTSRQINPQVSWINAIGFLYKDNHRSQRYCLLFFAFFFSSFYLAASLVLTDCYPS